MTEQETIKRLKTYLKLSFYDSYFFKEARCKNDDCKKCDYECAMKYESQITELLKEN